MKYYITKPNMENLGELTDNLGWTKADGHEPKVWWDAKNGCPWIPNPAASTRDEPCQIIICVY